TVELARAGLATHGMSLPAGKRNSGQSIVRYAPPVVLFGGVVIACGLLLILTRRSMATFQSTWLFAGRPTTRDLVVLRAINVAIAFTILALGVGIVVLGIHEHDWLPIGR